MELKVLISCHEVAEARLILEGISAATRGEINGDAEDLSATLQRGAQAHPDVLLLENRCCDPASRKMLLRLSESPGRIRVLLLCDKYTTERFLEFVSRGVSGCLSRHADFRVLAKAVRTVHAGQPWFDRASLMDAIRRQACDSSCRCRTPHEHSCLTSREEQMMRCVGAGLSNREIARELRISVNTVQTVLHGIYSKVQISGRYKVLAALASPATAEPNWAGSVLQGESRVPSH